MTARDIFNFTSQCHSERASERRESKNLLKKIRFLKKSAGICKEMFRCALGLAQNDNSDTMEILQRTFSFHRKLRGNDLAVLHGLDMKNLKSRQSAEPPVCLFKRQYPTFFAQTRRFSRITAYASDVKCIYSSF